MPFNVFLTNGATHDLEELYEYIVLHDVPGNADYVLAQIEKVFSSLSEAPDRGVFPKELLSL
jgi:toxin ParE1/3/4